MISVESLTQDLFLCASECQWVPTLKKPQKKIRGGGLVCVFFSAVVWEQLKWVSALLLVVVAELYDRAALLQPRLGWRQWARGLKQRVQLVVPGCGASSALEGCTRTVYLGLAALAVSSCYTGVGTLAQCAVLGSARNALGTQQCCLGCSEAVAASGCTLRVL